MSTTSGEAIRWFYVRGGRRHGPVETTKLVDLVLGGEVAENALVWHSGLVDWLPARDIEEIRRELPPPLPSPTDPPPPDSDTIGVTTTTEAEEPSEGDPWKDEASPELPTEGDPGSNSDGLKRRRKRKHRHRDSKRRPAWLWPLVVILVGLMIFLWWLLRRMNEVPPGRIIQTGFLLEPKLHPEIRPRVG
jgi:GYF domain 2